MTKKQELIVLLEKLVGHVINQDELGGCVWCGGSGKEGNYGYCDETYDCHSKKCPWVEGNRMLQKLKTK
jgi:hypothetical protein